ncbi:tyrosine-type recombinase/integrase [Desulfosporosinus metallidurans]
MKTGLRSGDIVKLQFINIDWKNDEIHIIQRKTNRPLILPLEPNVGNAIYDYVLHGRPVADSPYIFLRTRPPHKKLCNSSLNSIICKYMDAIGVSHKPGEKKGFHSFRRSLGTWMLENEVPLDTIKEVLGHSHMNSSRPYLSTNLEKLKNCSLSLDGIEVTREELMR